MIMTLQYYCNRDNNMVTEIMISDFWNCIHVRETLQAWHMTHIHFILYPIKSPSNTDLQSDLSLGFTAWCWDVAQ